MKPNKQKLFVVALALLVAVSVIFIFANSLKDSDTSNAASSKIAEIVKPIFDAVFGEGKINVHYAVRKIAHFSEFALLGTLTLAFVGALTEYTGKKLFFCGLFGTLAVAVLDEYIQSFTGRTSRVSDILIDFAGALFGMAAAFLIYLLIRKVKK